jgi:hypothetical protein
MAPVKRMDALKKQLGEMEQQVRAASSTRSTTISPHLPNQNGISLHAGLKEEMLVAPPRLPQQPRLSCDWHLRRAGTRMPDADSEFFFRLPTVTEARAVGEAAQGGSRVAAVAGRARQGSGRATRSRSTSEGTEHREEAGGEWGMLRRRS